MAIAGAAPGGPAQVGARLVVFGAPRIVSRLVVIFFAAYLVIVQLSSL